MWARVTRLLDQLDDRHRSRVAVARWQFDDSRVASRAFLVSLEVRREELVRYLAVVDVQRDLAARIEVVGLGVGDDPLDPSTQLLGLRLGGRDPAVAQQGGHLVARHRLAMRRAAPELPTGDAMPHEWLRLPRHRLEQRFQLFGSDQLALHELLANLVERLLPEVAERQQLFLLHRDQLPDLGDVVRLEAVERTNAELEVLNRDVGEAAREVVATGLALLRRGEVVAEPDEEPEVLSEETCGTAHRLDRRESPVGPHLDHQLVPLSLLTDAGLLDEEVRLAHRGEDGADRDDADRLTLFLVALGSDVALAALDHQVHAELR